MFSAVRRIENVDYYNCGDWVESCSAIVEHDDGRLELLNHLRAREQVSAQPVRVPLFGPGSRFEAYDTSQTQTR